MRLILTISLLFIVCTGFSQELKGKWLWNNENLSGEVFFGEGTYLIKVFINGTDSKVTESFQYYKISNDTITFSEIDFASKPTVLSRYIIKDFDNNKIEFLDISTNEIDTYKNVNHKDYNLSKFNYDEFYFNGGISCISREVSHNYNNCLNFSSFSMLSSKQDIENILGQPSDVINQNGIEYYIYTIPNEKDEQSYFAISLNKDSKLETIQLTGDKSYDKFSFSGIRLGDYYSMVEKRIGKPTEISMLDDKTELWSYDPHRISLEIKNGMVYSIKLRRI